MKLVVALIIGFQLVVANAHNASASTIHRHDGQKTLFAPATFTLKIAGAVAPSMQFWVAHGPLNGRFGVIRLRSQSSHAYSATVSLPLTQKTSFTFLASTDTKVVHGLQQPSGTIVVIRTFEASRATTVAHQTVHWDAPLG